VDSTRLRLRPERAEETAPRSSESATAVPARILVVDDEAWVRDLLGGYLSAAGYSVTHAASADEAFAAVRRDRPDLVLLDTGFPDLDGLEVLRRIQAEEPAIGVILLAGNQDVVLARAGLQIGAIDCLFKPSGLDRLGSAVALGLTRLRSAKVGAA
jgi:DNA-binding response OmpR family regulator